MRTEDHSPHMAEGAYEKTDANPYSLAIFAAVIVITLVITYVLMVATFRFFAKTQPLGNPSSPFATQRVLPPEPRLQADPRQDLQNFRRQESDNLNSYGWINPSAGIVKIPIDRAMDRMLEKGYPVQGQPAGKK